MFEYSLDDNSMTFFDADGQIKFDPPAYEQRYSIALRIIQDARWKTEFKKIVEFGCADLRLLTLLRRVPGVQHIVEVDIDETILQQYKQNATPLSSDYLQKREAPLRIEIYKGSIDTSVNELRNTDVVIGLEIIEHLYAEVLDKVPDNVFGFMQPKLVIFSTPNSEFNVIFGASKFPNGFRHLDHKFEWTRAEFQQWASSICSRYPNYCVTTIGVGKPPPEHASVGHLTQLAIFARLDLLDKPLIHPIAHNLSENTDPDLIYKEIYAVDFPFVRDERTKAQKIWVEAQYHVERYRRIDDYLNSEQHIYKIPLSELMCQINREIYTTEAELREVLEQNSIIIEGDFVILSEFDDYDSDEYTDYNKDLEVEEQFPTVNNCTDVKHDSDENWD